MDLKIYEILQGPVVTDKAYQLNRDLKKLVFWVHPKANKPLIKEACAKLFDVKVDNVRIVVRAGKTRRIGRRTVVGSTKKKAIITLAEGYSFPLFDQSGSGIMPAENPTDTAQQ